MELRRYAHILRRRILLLFLAVAVGLAAGYLVGDRTTSYRAEASIYVGSRQFAALADTTSAGIAMERLTQTFASMVKSYPVAMGAIRVAGVPRTPSQVVSATAATAVPNANYIKVFVTDTDPAIAQSLANGVAQSFVTQVQNLEPGTPPAAGAPVVASVFQEAIRPATALPTSTTRNLLLGGIFGTAFGLGLIALLDHLDISVKAPEAIEWSAGLPVLATVPILSRSDTRAQKTNNQPSPTRPGPTT